MPQVHAVGTLAYPYEGRKRPEAPEQTDGVHHNGDHDRSQNGAEKQASAIGEGAGAVGERRQCYQTDKRGDSDAVKYALLPVGKLYAGLGPQSMGWPHEGQYRSDEQCEGAAVGPVIDAGGVGFRVVQNEHQHR